jgi:tetratricopeptide (TPR) repeat protein
MGQVDSLIRSAVSAFNAGSPDSAQALCQEGLRLAPDDAALHHLLANILFAKGDPKGAAAHLTPSLRRQSANPPARKLAAKIARQLWERGEAAGAAALLTQIVDTGSPASLWFDLGLARQDIHDRDGAAAAYRAALARQPTMAEAAVNLGVVLQEAGDMAGAMAAYGKAYRLRPATFGMIAHALTSAPNGRLWLDPEALKRALSA